MEKKYRIAEILDELSDLCNSLSVGEVAEDVDFFKKLSKDISFGGQLFSSLVGICEFISKCKE